MDKPKVYVEGMFANKRDGSPEFVVSKLSIKVAQFIIWLKQHENNAGYVNIDLLTSSKTDSQNNQYGVLNEYSKPEPTEEVAQVEEVKEPLVGLEGETVDIPF